MSRHRTKHRPRAWAPTPEPLPADVTDDHTHIDAVPSFARAVSEHAVEVGEEPLAVPTPASLVERAQAVGVTRIVHCGCELPALEPAVRLAEQLDGVVAALAIHPNEAALHAGVREVGPDGLPPRPQPWHATSLDAAIARVRELAVAHPRVRAIGETGLDFFRTGDQGRDAQIASFRAHIALAKELRLPLQIHDRDAHRDVVETLLADGAPERTVFHAFSGDAELARRCAEQGWYLSFGGAVTFAPNESLRQALRVTPLDRVLVETDAPYLTPHPYRSRPNAPWMLPYTVRVVADVLQQPLVEVCTQVQRTSEALFGPF